jgi:peptide/nickel transport system substrate-binding protein
MVLVGQASVARNEPDLFPFWHSSQTTPPGFNFSLYQNKEVDKLIEQLREVSEPSKREQLYQQVDNLIRADQPAAFLYAPRAVWIIKDHFLLPEIKAINGFGEKFSKINQWYLYQKRVWN